MLEPIEGLPEGVIGVEAVGHVTADDYRTVLDPAVSGVIERTGKVRLLVVFGDAFEGVTAGGAWEDAKLGIGDWRAWERIAVVTSHAGMRDAIRAFGWLSPGDIKAYEPAERDDAIAWLAA